MLDELKEVGVPERVLQVITGIYGFSEETMRNILHAYTGKRTFPFEENLH